MRSDVIRSANPLGDPRLRKMATVHFPSNVLGSKIFKKANGCLLKDRRKTGG